MPLLWLGLCVIAGILVSAHVQVAWYFWAILIFSGFLISLPEYLFSKKHHHPLLSKKLFCVPFGLLLAAFALGGWRFQAAFPKPTSDDLAFYQPSEKVAVTGTIISFPELSSNSSTAIIKAQKLSFQGKERLVIGNLELRLPGGFHLTYGDRLKLEGALKSTFIKDEPFYASYLARKGILTRMAYPQIETLSQGLGNPLMAFIYHTRERAVAFIENQMPVEESSLLSGILLGIDWHIPRYLEDAYRATGTVHIIAISGFNIALISGMVIRLFRRLFTPVWAGVMAILAILFYTLMVGAEPSVVRAAIMGSLSIPAYYIGRRIIGIHSLTVAAAVMALLNPLLMWDIGFQLSFLATLGLMVLADPVVKWLQARLDNMFSEKTTRAAAPAVILIASTLCAQFTVSPVVLGMNPGLQLYSLAANLIILPLQPPLMVLGGAAILANFIFPPFGALLARLTWVLARICNQVALHLGKVRFAEVKLPDYSTWIACGVVMIVILFATIREIQEIAKPTLPN
ncbi:MAG: ComEC family competence protein [Anaerolineaceae bacterium]|nr:ComEC family competence protein [Anaerolineaceae bacterium]